jgi:mono/diheme cytochrome c family protein
LFGITKFGLKPYVGASYESDMPAFEGVLSDAEITSILDYIKSTWPAEAREWQENVSRNE